MIRSLIQTGNSKALILTKDMRDHLGIDEEVAIEFRRSAIILRHPDASPDDDETVGTKDKLKEPRAPKPPKAEKVPKPEKAEKAAKTSKAPKPPKADKISKEKTKAKKGKSKDKTAK
jgi:hypothetical protein